MGTWIYLDHAATTPLDPRIAFAMQGYLGEGFGNPSSLHWAGKEAHEGLDQARAEVAALINAEPSEIVFTGGGTEADNLALRGVLEPAIFAGETVHLIVSAFEHPAVMETARYLERRGVAVTYLPVTADGLVQAETLEAALRPETRLVSIMGANNVVGTIQPVGDLARVTRAHGALFHSDAVQAFGKVPLDMGRTPIDLLSMSAHTLHGPKGIGALYVRKGVRLEPVLFGGGQERGLRSGTENVAAAVGFGRAAELAHREMGEEAARLVGLRERLVEGIGEAIDNVYFIGHPYFRLPGHLCVGFAGQEGEAVKLLLALDDQGIAVSSGSACSSNHAGEPSYILTAMGYDQIRARGSLRISMGRFTTEEEVDALLQALPRAVASLRTIASHASFAARD